MYGLHLVQLYKRYNLSSVMWRGKDIKLESPPRPLAPGTRLSLENVGFCLLGQGLVGPKEILQPGFSINERGRRSRNFEVIFGEGRGIFVKQPREPANPDVVAELETESRFLDEIATSTRFKTIAWALPKKVWFTRQDCILVTDLFQPATTLTNFFLNAGDVHFPDAAISTAASILAEFHTAGAAALGEKGLGFLPKNPAFVWQFLEIRFEPWKKPVELDFQRRVMARTLLLDRFAAVRAAWQDHDGVLHGDLRWENLLLLAGKGPNKRMNMRLIDLEFAVRGDCAWDVSFYLCASIRFWLLCATTSSQIGNLEGALEEAPFPISQSAASAGSFFHAYANAKGLSGTEQTDLLARVLHYVPLILVQFGFEMTLYQEKVPPNSEILLNLACAAAADPATFARQWFNLGAQGDG